MLQTQNKSRRGFLFNNMIYFSWQLTPNPPEFPYQPQTSVRPAAILLPFSFLPPSSTYGFALMLLFTICNAGLYFTIRVCHARVVWTWFLQYLLWDSGLKIVTKFGFYTLYFLMEIKITALMNQIIYLFIFIALKCNIWSSYAFLTRPFLIP